MTERGKDILLWGLTVLLLLFQVLVLERRGENAAAHLGYWRRSSAMPAGAAGGKAEIYI